MSGPTPFIGSMNGVVAFTIENILKNNSSTLLCNNSRWNITIILVHLWPTWNLEELHQQLLGIKWEVRNNLNWFASNLHHWSSTKNSCQHKARVQVIAKSVNCTDDKPVACKQLQKHLHCQQTLTHSLHIFHGPPVPWPSGCGKLPIAWVIRAQF